MHGSLRSRTHHRPAFTLVELVIVLTITGILASVAVPRVSRSITHHRVTMGSGRVAADLAMASWHAQEHSVDLTVSFDVTNNQYTMADVQDLDSGGVNYRVKLMGEPYGVQLLSADFDVDADVIFNIYGTPDSGGSAAVGAGGWVKTITLDGDSGEVTIN